MLGKKGIKDQTKYAPPFQDNFSHYIGFYSIWLFQVNLGWGMQLNDEHPRFVDQQLISNNNDKTIIKTIIIMMIVDELWTVTYSV